MSAAGAEDPLDDPDKGERKRQREKQRRSDLATAFEELQMTLNHIEHGTYGRLGKVDFSTETPVTRLGLVLQTTETLQRLHQENLHMRMTLGGQWQEESSRRSAWSQDQGHGYYGHHHYPQPPYYQGYTDVPYHTQGPTQSHAYSSGGYSGGSEAWDRGGTPHAPHPSSMGPPSVAPAGYNGGTSAPVRSSM